jgi:hypothetical protein
MFVAYDPDPDLFQLSLSKEDSRSLNNLFEQPLRLPETAEGGLEHGIHSDLCEVPVSALLHHALYFPMTDSNRGLRHPLLQFFSAPPRYVRHVFEQWLAFLLRFRESIVASCQRQLLDFKSGTQGPDVALRGDENDFRGK